jgi:hypothetical protein
MEFWDILGWMAAAGIGWLFWSSLKAREAANHAIRAACKRESFFFLDDTVGLRSIWPVRDDEGRMTLRRIYGFEYSDTGNNRRYGAVTMMGTTPADVHVESAPLREGS